MSEKMMNKKIMMSEKRREEALFIITRPDETGKILTDNYLQSGCHAIHLPVMQYKMLADDGDDGDGNNDDRKKIDDAIMTAAGLAFTSANGVKAFLETIASYQGDKKNTAPKKNTTPKKNIGKNIFVVGPMTAAAAKIIGNENIITAGGDVEKLTETIIAEYHKKPWQGTLLHIGATATSGESRGTDLVTRLQNNNIVAKKIALYDMVAVEKIATNQLQIIADHKNQKIILFFSPRTAVLTASLLKNHGLAPKDFFAKCHSPAVATVAQSLGFLMMDDA